jgi:hypothetical protein
MTMRPIQIAFILWIAFSVLGFGAITVMMILEMLHSTPACP